MGNDLTKNFVLDTFNQVVVGAMAPIMNIFAQSLVAIAMISLVILMNPILAIISALSLAFAYGSIYYFLRGYLFRIGSKRIDSSQEKHRVVNEAFYWLYFYNNLHLLLKYFYFYTLTIFCLIILIPKPSKPIIFLKDLDIRTIFFNPKYFII